MNKKLAFLVALVMVLQVCAISIASAIEIEVSTPDKKELAKTQKLIDNRPTTKRQMENLDRGVVAVKVDNGVYLSWRWLGTESKDVMYDVYHNGQKLTPAPLNNTNFTDLTGDGKGTYYVTSVLNGKDLDKSKEVSVWNDNSLTIKIDKPAPWIGVEGDDEGKPHEYSPGDSSVGDLDGDGEYEIVLEWGAVGRDNGQGGITSNVIYDAYKLNGKKLWRIDAGPNIRCGAHYNDFMVQDYDGDGKAEFVIKTADGTVDGKGKVIGDPKAIWRNTGGFILEGPEFLTIFNGETGAAMDTVDYDPPRGNVGEWGDGYGNRVDRFLACTPYLDGVHPSVVMCRGYYTRMVLAAWDFVDGKLKKRWRFDQLDKGNEAYYGKGNHSVTTTDVDFDGKDEIIYGASLIDHDGKGVYPHGHEGLGHGDAQHTGDLIPSRPGLEIFSVHEYGYYGENMRDARTGEIIWNSEHGDTGSDVGRGASDMVDPRFYGAVSTSTLGKLVDPNGNVIEDGGYSMPYNFFAFWDGDLLREVQDKNYIAKWDPVKKKANAIFVAKDCVSINGTKATPTLTADLFGDWREETIYAAKDGNSIKIFTSTFPTDYRIYTLMHDPQYRNYIATQNAGYNQPPHIGFYLGTGVKDIPIPYIYTNNSNKEVVSNPDLTADNAKNKYPIGALTNSQSLSLAINVNKAIVGNTVFKIDADNQDVTPIIKDGRTLVPVRVVSEAFGAKVDWNASTQGITITKDKKTINMTINQTDYTVSGAAKKLDVPAQIINGRTFIPLRAMAEALDKKVFWDPQGLIVIGDVQSAYDTQGSAILIKTLKDAPVPAVKEAVATIEGKQLLENQLPIVAVSASSDDGNTPEGAVDGNSSTRWSALGKDDTPSWLMVDLGEAKNIKGIACSHWSGDSRTYTFDIEVSTDGKKWTKILDKVESGGTTALEVHDFPKPTTGRYVRLVGYGSGVNGFTHVTDIVVLAAK